MRAPPTAPTAQQIDAAVSLLRDMAIARGWNSLAVEVRPDGRVEIRVDGRRAFADLLPGGSHPTPGAAIGQGPEDEAGGIDTPRKKEAPGLLTARA